MDLKNVVLLNNLGRIYKKGGSVVAKSLDLVGRRFGKLVVEEQLGEKQERYHMWRCCCDCGGEIYVNTKRLQRGTITNCGCVPKKMICNGPIAENLSGKQFGELTVLYRVSNRRGRTCWLCRCSCGRLHTCTAQSLKRGSCTSCGSGQHRIGKGVLDITGQRFGRLLACYTTDQRDKKGSVYWHCRCDCGNELNVTEDGLVHGNYRSCGCLKEEICGNINRQLHRIDGTCLEWLEKRKHRSDNTSGFRGVYLLKNGRYRATIGFKKQRFYIGTYMNFDEAVQARLEVEQLIHGGFVAAYYSWLELGTEIPFIFEVEKRNQKFWITTNIDIEK